MWEFVVFIVRICRFYCENLSFLLWESVVFINFMEILEIQITTWFLKKKEKILKMTNLLKNNKKMQSHINSNLKRLLKMYI